MLDLDRGTERQQVWRDKITALVLWVASAGDTALPPSSYVTIMIVTPTDRRRDCLRSWTAQELRSCGHFNDYADTIAITADSLSEGVASGRSARPEPGLPVEKFPGDVQVTGMPRGLLDHVQHDAAQVRRFVLSRDAVPAAR